MRWSDDISIAGQMQSPIVVVRAVAEQSGCSPAMLLGQNRARYASWPRQVMYLLLVEHCQHLSPYRLAQEIGRDPRTFSYGLKRARLHLEEDSRLRDMYQNAKRRLSHRQMEAAE